jgi:RNA polymerase sigma factor (TIGR02999 family)
MLQRAARGERGALDQLLPAIYEELRHLARQLMAAERHDHTLQSTALVHEAYLRLIDQRNIRPEDRNHFFAAAATTIRRILVDHARAHSAAKRGQGWERMSIESIEPEDESRPLDLLALEDALEKLSRLSERAGKVVTMRYFGGLTVDQIAQALNVSARTIADDWTMARAWLRRELGGSTGDIGKASPP